MEKLLKAGLLLGYSKNYGISVRIRIKESEPIYTRGANIDYLYRISPYIKWSKSRIRAMGRNRIYDCCLRRYRLFKNKGKVINSKELTNIRIQFSCVYLIL
jgi:hypothetical protein